MALQLRGGPSTKVKIVSGALLVPVLCLSAFLGLRAGPVSHALDTPEIVINEFSANGSDDWVELYNTTDHAMSLAGWLLKDGSATNSKSLSGTLNAHEFLVVDFSNYLNQNTDTIHLLDGSSKEIDIVTYTVSGPIAYPGLGQSTARIDEGNTTWAVGAPTKGSANDTEAPTIDLQEPQDGSVFGRNEQFTVKAHLTDNAGLENYRLLIDGLEQPQPMAAVGLDINVTFNANDFTTGQHTIVAWATDDTGNESPHVTRTITIDKTAPSVTFTSPAPGSLVHGLVIGASFHDDSGLSQYGFDVQGPGVNFSTPNYKTTEKDISLEGFDLCAAAYYGDEKCPGTLASGVYTVRAKAYDKYGNKEASTTWQVTVDRDAPSVAVTSPFEGQVIGGHLLELQGSATDPSGIGEYRYQLLDANKDNTLGNSVIGGNTAVDNGVLGVIDISNLPSGNYFARVWATDALGNKSSPVYVGFAVDHTPPQVTMQLVSSGTPSASTPVIVSGHVSESAMIKLWLNGEELSDLPPITVDTEGNWQARLDEGLARGNYTLVAQATDPYGNSGSSAPIGVAVGALVTDERISSGLTAGLDDPFVVPQIFGSVTPPALDQEAADDTEVLGVKQNDESAVQAVKDTAVAATEAGWKLFGVMWYWWALGGVTLGGMTWTAMALAKRQMAEDAL